jgi:hypothetical protein
MHDYKKKLGAFGEESVELDAIEPDVRDLDLIE